LRWHTISVLSVRPTPAGFCPEDFQKGL
jgi:hypothetical protein